jgi:hypothetical protein
VTPDERFWPARLRWRLRGAWLWPLFLVLTLAAVAGPQLVARAPRARLHALIACGAILAGVAANAAFNLFRYGSPRNTFLLSPGLRVPSASRWLEQFAGLWISPSGGLVVFWPWVVLLLAAGLAIGFRHLRRAPLGEGKWIPAAAIAVALLGLTGGLATWFQAFGWWAWGPRLMLPWLPAWVFALLLHYGPALERGMKPLVATPVRTAVLIAVLIAAVSPHVAIVFDPRGVDRHFAPDATCPGVPPTYDVAGYWGCMHHYMWTKTPMILRPFSAYARVESILVLGAFAVALGALAAAMRSEPTWEGSRARPMTSVGAVLDRRRK